METRAASSGLFMFFFLSLTCFLCCKRINLKREKWEGQEENRFVDGSESGEGRRLLRIAGKVGRKVS